MGQDKEIRISVDGVGSRRGRKRDEDDEPSDLELSPLFSNLSDEFSHVMVIRVDPDEGHLGRLPAECSELDIKRRWGGGTYQLQARNFKNQPIKGGFRTITCAGDPIFESQAAQKKWLRANGLDGDDRRDTSPSQARGFDMLQFLNVQHQQQMQALQAQQAADREKHARDLDRLKAESELRLAELRLQMEAREKERKEDAERRDREAAAARLESERLRTDQAQRDREFYATMLKFSETKNEQKGAKSGSDLSMVDVLIKGISLARDLTGGGGEGGYPDATTAIIDKLPETIREIRETGAAMVAAGGSKGKRGKGTNDDDDDTVTFEGELGRQAKAVVKSLQARGADPGKVFARAFEVMARGNGAGGAGGQAARATATTQGGTEIPVDFIPPAKRKKKIPPRPRPRAIPVAKRTSSPPAPAPAPAKGPK